MTPTKTVHPHSSATDVAQLLTSPSVHVIAAVFLDATSARSAAQLPASLAGAASEEEAASPEGATSAVDASLGAPPSTPERTVQSELHAASARTAATTEVPRKRLDLRFTTATDSVSPARAQRPSNATLRAMRVQGRRKLAGAFALACVFAAGTARASDAEIDARSAYDRGLVAHERGDELEAAQDFAEADRLQPSSAALEAAISSALRADDPVLVMQLVERARGRELDAAARSTVARGRAASANRVVRIVVDCGRAARCTISIDGGAAENADVPVFVVPAKHSLAIDRDGARQLVDTSAAGGETVRVTLGDAPPAEPAAALPRSDLPSTHDENEGAWKKPVAFAAIGASVVLAGITVGSAVDSAAKRSDFNRDHCGTDAPPSTVPAADCSGLADAGKSAQTRTNVLLATTAVVGVATAVFVIVARPFASSSASVTMAASTGGASVAVRFP